MAILIIIAVFVIAGLIGLLGWLIARENREYREHQRPQSGNKPEQDAAARREQRRERETADAADELLVEYEQKRELDKSLTGAALLSVLDGDTISVISASGVVMCVRLYAIDAPELEQIGGYAARDFLERLLKTGGGFTMSTYYTDPYGRIVAALYPNDADTASSYNWAMVANGYAHWLPDFGGAELGLNDAQEFAQAEGLGIWQWPAPELPASFRRRKQVAAGNPGRRERAGHAARADGSAAFGKPGVPLPPHAGDRDEETLLALVLQNEAELATKAAAMASAEWFRHSENREAFRIITGGPTATAEPGRELTAYLEQLRARPLGLCGTSEQSLQKLCLLLKRKYQNNTVIELMAAVQESGDLYSSQAVQIAALMAQRRETDRVRVSVQLYRCATAPSQPGVSK